jgi:mono/diheme cytochrome c family protein
MGVAMLKITEEEVKQLIIKVSTIILVFFIATFVSCKGEKEGNSESTETGKETTSEQAEIEEVEIESVSPINHELAEKGEEAFKNKGCTACHTIGKGKLTGPDLAGVTQRRKLEWIENQILHPEEMLEKDPIAKELLATYLIRMPNQGVTPEAAKAIIMYLRVNDSEMKEEPEEEHEQ